MTNNWLTSTINECFHSPSKLLIWYVLHMEEEVFSLQGLLTSFLIAQHISRIDLSGWPHYHLGAGVQEIEGNAPLWLEFLQEQMGWGTNPYHTALRPVEIISDIAWAWDRIE